MSYAAVINWLYIIVTIVNFLVALVFLIVALINHRQCFNFPTLLACNTALATLIFSATNRSLAIYMFIWDHQTVPVVDSLCPIRGYLHHSTIAWIHHSFILQALEKYLKVRGITFFRTRSRQIGVVLCQWTFDFTFGLPALLTGNMEKLSSDNLCFVTLRKLYFPLYMAALSFLLTNIILTIVYKSLLRYVRDKSSRMPGNHQTQMRRDLTMVRRIILLNLQLAVVGLPVLVCVILNVTLNDHLPVNIMRIIILIANLPMSAMLAILFWMTPDLKRSLIDGRNQVPQHFVTITNRVQPQTVNTRF